MRDVSCPGDNSRNNCQLLCRAFRGKATTKRLAATLYRLSGTIYGDVFWSLYNKLSLLCTSIGYPSVSLSDLAWDVDV